MAVKVGIALTAFLFLRNLYHKERRNAMIDGTLEGRQAVLQAAEVVGQLAKYSFIGICYLGISLAVAIKFGDKTVKVIKSYVPGKGKEGSTCQE